MQPRHCVGLECVLQLLASALQPCYVASLQPAAMARDRHMASSAPKQNMCVGASVWGPLPPKLPMPSVCLSLSAG